MGWSVNRVVRQSGFLVTSFAITGLAGMPMAVSQPKMVDVQLRKLNKSHSVDSVQPVAELNLSVQAPLKFKPIPLTVNPSVLDSRCLEWSCDQLAQTETPPESPELNPRPDPNQDRFLQPEPQPPQPEPPPQPDFEPQQPSPTDPPPDTTPIPVNTVEVVGSSILTPAEIAAIVSPLEGRSVTLQDLQEAADNITEIYLERGYITSRAIVPEQTITDGMVTIQVIEGTLAEIEIEGTQRLNPEYIRSRVRLGAGQPLSTPRLEDQLRLLRVNPLFESVEASLRAGTEEGESILIVRVIEADAFQVGLSMDNYSPPSIGSERLGVSLRHLNLTGNGDLLFVSYNTTRLITDGESDVVDFLYSYPVNAMNGTIQLRIPPYRNRIIQEEFEPLNIEGTSQRYELSYRQPLLRTPAEEFALSLGFSFQESDISFDAEEEFEFAGETRTNVFKFGQDYVRRDPQGAWALRSQFSLGVDILDATTNNSGPSAGFLSWLGQVQRVQRLSDAHLLIAQGELQLSADPLFPSQQFVLGGALSLRGYRQNIRAGDNGFRFSVEDRITLLRDETGSPTLQLAPFVELGKVWNHRDNPNLLLDQTFLMGTGLGILWQPVPDLNIRVDYGLPLIDLEDKGDNLQDHGLYFSINFTPF
jgi:hemolysin activation/secretion protein